MTNGASQNIESLPTHVAIIMDGNGRWARERGLPRIRGHQKGVETIREVVRTAQSSGIQYLTLYAFSKENWARASEEVSFLMNLLAQYLDSELKELCENGIRFSTIGEIGDLPSEVQKKIERNRKETAANTGMQLTLALSYSSRVEIVQAVKHIAQSVLDHKVGIDEIDEQLISQALYTKNLPDPDLLIRTSGELRISNFLLWQISYTEIYVVDKYWPEFTKADFSAALDEYRSRDRRFGKEEGIRRTI